ncbi:MAG: SDR family oxidoreductase [Sphingobacteriales bacterium]|nr:MAG: SDR family oxidoreductase [Sphingobacteriales bacterium]
MTKKVAGHPTQHTEKGPFSKHLQVAPIPDTYRGSGKLDGKVAIITGGDSGIGRSVALYFAREGAEVALVYHKSEDDAQLTADWVRKEGKEPLLIKGDLAKEAFSGKIVDQTLKRFGKIDILINNAGVHEEDARIEGISKAQLYETFESNTFPVFYLIKAVLPHLSKGSSIINTGSVVAYRGSEHLMDYAASKGALVALTRSLSTNLASKGVRVNGVAPGPVWTPLVVAAFTKDKLKKFGTDVPMGRAGYPFEIAPAYVFLASDDSAYITGQFIHVNGGEIINA